MGAPYNTGSLLMFWPVLGLAALATVFFQLGASSVSLSIARVFFFVALLAAGAWLFQAAWRRIARRGESDR